MPPLQRLPERKREGKSKRRQKKETIRIFLLYSVTSTYIILNYSARARRCKTALKLATAVAFDQVVVGCCMLSRLEIEYFHCQAMINCFAWQSMAQNMLINGVMV